MVDRLSWFSFSSREVIGFLSGIEDESVVFQQGQWIGHQIVQPWIAQAERRLCLARRLLLAQNIGDVIGSESTGCGSFFDCVGYRLGAVLADELQQLSELPRECAIGIGDVTQIAFQHDLGADTIENREETLLRS
jgi:hypothetical protein